MNAERWKQIDELFDAVLEIPNERREEFLSEKCSGDDDLKREVLSLLKAQKEARTIYGKFGDEFDGKGNRTRPHRKFFARR